MIKNAPAKKKKKNPPALQEIWVRSLDWEDPLVEGMATHSSILAWIIPGQRSLAGCSPWDHKDLDVTEHTLALADSDAHSH